MKFFKLVFMSLSVVVLLSACSSIDQARKNKKDKKAKAKLARILPEEAAEAKKFAASQAENYYKALKNNDYESFCKSRKANRKDFDKWHQSLTKTFGKLESQSYMGSIANPLFIRYMWKWNFKRNRKGKTFNRQILYNVYIVKDKVKNKYILVKTGLQQ